MFYLTVFVCLFVCLLETGRPAHVLQKRRVWGVITRGRCRGARVQSGGVEVTRKASKHRELHVLVKSGFTPCHVAGYGLNRTEGDS